jgi:hypothetical protein
MTLQTWSTVQVLYEEERLNSTESINLGSPVLALGDYSSPPVSRLLPHPIATMETVRPTIPSRMLKPTNWLSLYEDFVAKNASSVGQVESALRSLTYIIPGATKRSESPGTRSLNSI